jgi:hypothetical protein
MADQRIPSIRNRSNWAGRWNLLALRDLRPGIFPSLQAYPIGGRHPLPRPELKNGSGPKIGGLIHIPDDASDRSLFNLPVQATGAAAFKADNAAEIGLVEKIAPLLD